MNELIGRRALDCQCRVGITQRMRGDGTQGDRGEAEESGDKSPGGVTVSCAGQGKKGEGPRSLSFT